MVIKNVIFELIGYYKKAIIIFFLIFAFLISPYNILLKLNTTTWVNVNFYEKIIMSLGYGFVLNAIPILWGALIYAPCWYFLSKRKSSDYRIELIYVIVFASAFFHLVILSMIYITEITFLKTFFIP